MRKSTSLILASIPILAGSVCLYIRAGALRLAAEAEFQGSVDFTIYSSPNNQRFAEDYLAVLLYLLAHILFIYGVWIRKSRDM